MRTPTALTRPPRRAVTAAAVAVLGVLALLLAGCTAQTPGLLSSSPVPGVSVRGRDRAGDPRRPA